MSNFIDNSTALPGAKVNAASPVGPTNENLTATEFNTVTQALADTRTVILRQASIMSFSPDPTGTTDSSAALVAAIAALPTGGTLHLPAGTYRVSVSVSIPANIHISFDSSLLSVDATKTVTINGSVVAPLSAQVFTGSGSVALAGPGPISVKWFGAKGDGSTNDFGAVQAALASTTQSASGDSGQRAGVFLPSGVYNVTSTTVALQMSPFQTLSGEGATLSSTSATVDIVAFGTFHGKIDNVNFVGGRNGVYLDNSDIDFNIFAVTRCEFWSQNGAGIATGLNAASSDLWISDCLFYNTNASAYLVSAQSPTVTIDNCRCHWGTATAFLCATDVSITRMTGTPLGGNTQWILVPNTGGQAISIFVDLCRFGGENGTSVVTWNNPRYPQQTPPNTLSIRRSQMYSPYGTPAFIFNDLPNVLEIIENVGGAANGIRFTSSIPDQSYVKGASDRFSIQNEYTLDPGGVTSPADRVLLSDVKTPLGTEMIAVSDVLLTSTPGQGSYTSNATHSSSTNIFGTYQYTVTSTSAPSNAQIIAGAGYGNSQLNSLAAGNYTATFDLELTGPASLQFICAGIQTWKNLPTGKALVNIPFVLDVSWVGLSNWAQNHTYTVGQHVQNNFSGAFIIVLKCVTAGISSATGTGPSTDAPGIQITDGTVTWEVVADLGLAIGWNPVGGSSTIRVGSIRVFNGNVTVNQPNTICYGSAVPTTGTWNKGDLVYNTAVTAAAGANPFLGWVCTTAGAAGTFVFSKFGAVTT